MGKSLDWSKTGTVVAMAEWLRDSSDAFAVIVLRRDDSVLALDPKLRPNDVEQLLPEHLPQLLANVEQARADKKRAARCNLEPPRE
jgi:hypothetical protein